jgi:hypothetical protein
MEKFSFVLPSFPQIQTENRNVDFELFSKKFFLQDASPSSGRPAGREHGRGWVIVMILGRILRAIPYLYCIFTRNAKHLFRSNSKRMTDLPKPVVFCGPSGVGKGTLIELLMKRFPNDQFGFSVSHTTRKPREGEVDGQHYNFTTVDEIKKEIADGKFIEYAEVHGNYYGSRYESMAERH